MTQQNRSYTRSYSSYTPSRRPTPVTPKGAVTPYHFSRFLLSVVAVISLGMLVFHIGTTHAASAHTPILTYTKKQTICIDPGHGGADPGATSTDGSVTERDINLTVALKMRQLLNADGYQVFMTRTTNTISMDNRVRYTYCNQHHATIMVSVHHNFFSDSTVDYTTDLFYKPVDKGLANIIAAATANQLNISNQGISQFEDGVLSESTMPAAVSEGFFITSDDEYNKLTSSNSTRLSDEATGIVTGIETYLSNPAKADASVTSVQTLNRTDD